MVLVTHLYFVAYVFTLQKTNNVVLNQSVHSKFLNYYNFVQLIIASIP